MSGYVSLGKVTILEDLILTIKREVATTRVGLEGENCMLRLKEKAYEHLV